MPTSSNSILKRRFARFRATRQAWWSLLALAVLYFGSLFSEIICNNKPLYVNFHGKSFFPVFFRYSENDFLNNGVMTLPNFDAPEFSDILKDSFAIWPIIHNHPDALISPDEIKPFLRTTCTLYPQYKISGICFDRSLTITEDLSLYINVPELSGPAIGRKLSDFWELPPELDAILAPRWQGLPAPKAKILLQGKTSTTPTIEITFAATDKRAMPREVIRCRLAPPDYKPPKIFHYSFNPGESQPIRHQAQFDNMPDNAKNVITQLLSEAVNTQMETSADDVLLNDNHLYKIICKQETVTYPFRPIPGHWLGIDDAGRDVAARLIYGLRIALNFGLILVICSTILGSAIGFAQGYWGGWLDITGQRLTEVWSAMPFLYIMIILGSIYGGSFTLLLFCYAIFNWIGISYYMRAEMLRLRNTAFVESAKCLGLPSWKIICRHILPNSLVPLITFFPFSLVGAIAALASLDYLGFGLPANTPSIGQLLQQAQNQRDAWWLILYPSITLFIVMFLGVFVGEGVRNAFDPKRKNKIQ